MRAWVWVAGAMLFAGPAMAFDTSACGSFFVGSWAADGERDVGGGRMSHYTVSSTYKADGSYTQTTVERIDGLPPLGGDQSGTWFAKPGPTPGTCEFVANPANAKAKDLVITVIDADTLKTASGIVETRVK